MLCLSGGMAGNQRTTPPFSTIHYRFRDKLKMAIIKIKTKLGQTVRSSIIVLEKIMNIEYRLIHLIIHLILKLRVLYMDVLARIVC